MATYQELKAQQEALNKQIQEVLATERATALTKIQEMVRELNITADQIFPNVSRSSTGKKVGARKGGTVEPKYRNLQTGETWTGRGKQPRWVAALVAAGTPLESLLINPSMAGASNAKQGKDAASVSTSEKVKGTEQESAPV